MSDDAAAHPFGSDTWLSQAAAEIGVKRCPRCSHVGCLTVKREFVASERFSLAGAQAKLSGRFEIVMRCSACELVGRLHE